jgi:hypothetical protein
MNTLIGKNDIQHLATTAINAVVEGEIDPVEAFIEVSKMEAAIELFKKNTRVRDMVIADLERNGGKHDFGAGKMEVCETGVKYDFSESNDSKLLEMYATMEAIKADIKERESFLKAIPVGGMVDPDTGEVLHKPSKTSKTSVKITFKK